MIPMAPSNLTDSILCFETLSTLPRAEPCSLSSLPAGQRQQCSVPSWFSFSSLKPTVRHREKTQILSKSSTGPGKQLSDFSAFSQVVPRARTSSSDPANLKEASTKAAARPRSSTLSCPALNVLNIFLLKDLSFFTASYSVAAKNLTSLQEELPVREQKREAGLSKEGSRVVLQSISTTGSNKSPPNPCPGAPEGYTSHHRQACLPSIFVSLPVSKPSKSRGRCWGSWRKATSR